MRFLILLSTVCFFSGCQDYIDSNKDALKKTQDVKDQVNQKVKDLEEEAEDLSDNDEIIDGEE